MNDRSKKIIHKHVRVQAGLRQWLSYNEGSKER